ncbi:alpha/beta fold hydrolase [Streptomyces sp. G45]|uniref:alpha/beta fold hydrolase n=1 Tax=Streptomyces sp. G45 TaxID=3406627 RepID=UPI003C25C0C6
MDTMVKVDGGEVWADDSGGTGSPLVLLHPGVGDSRVWDPVLPALAEHHRVLRYDARGFGRSPAPTATYSQLRDLTAVLDHFGVERAVCAASSMGGATALSLALAAPERVAGLALFGPGATGATGLASPEFNAEVERLATAGDIEGVVRLALGVWAACDPSPDGPAADQLRGAVPAWFATYGHDVADAPTFDRLHEVTAPCVLALGERDQTNVVTVNEEMAARIPGCRLVRLDDCDHFPTLRRPAKVTELILELAARAA